MTTTPHWVGGIPLARKGAVGVESLVGRCDDGINWALIRLAQSSVAEFSVVPLQDVLGLGRRGAIEHAKHT